MATEGGGKRKCRDFDYSQGLNKGNISWNRHRGCDGSFSVVVSVTATVRFSEVQATL